MVQAYNPEQDTPPPSTAPGVVPGVVPGAVWPAGERGREVEGFGGVGAGADVRWLRAAASEALAPYVRGYAECHLKVPPGETRTMGVRAHVEPVATVLCSGEATVDLGRGAGLGERFRLPWLSLTGPKRAPAHLTFGCDVTGFFVHFRALGPRMLLGVRGAGYGLSPRLDALAAPDLAPALRAWALAVRRAPGFRARVRLSEAFWGALVPEASDRLGALHVALGALEALPPRRTREAAAAAGVSGAVLRRWFREEIGLSPRDVAAIVRVARACAHLEQHPREPLRDVAARFGFPDARALRRACARYAGGLPAPATLTADAGLLRAAEVAVRPVAYLR